MGNMGDLGRGIRVNSGGLLVHRATDICSKNGRGGVRLEVEENAKKNYKEKSEDVKEAEMIEAARRASTVHRNCKKMTFEAENAKA